MTEFDYILHCFEQKITVWKGKRIVLYGINRHTLAILDRYDSEFHFLGVIADPERFPWFSAKPIVSAETVAELTPDLILLTERLQYAEDGYEQLRDRCVSHGIALWDFYGLDWIAMRADLDSHHYNSIQEWLDITSGYDIISFEELDCFMEQRLTSDGIVLHPRPVFRILSSLLQSNGK